LEILDRIFIVGIFGLIIFTGIVIGIIIFKGPPKPIPIKASEFEHYVGERVITNVTVSKELGDETKFAFFILVPIYNGKTTTIILIPIFHRYNVYQTREGLVIAIRKPQTLSSFLGERLTVIGIVKQDGKGAAKYVLFIESFQEAP